MLISQLVEQLQRMQEAHGDIDVHIEGEVCSNSLSHVEYYKDSEDSTCVLVW